MTTSSLTSRRRRSAPKLPAAPQWPEFVGSWPRLTGRQEPEFESRHPGDESEGDRCAKFGARVGLRCMPWEWQTLRGILSLQPPNEYGERLWTHRDVAIECTRQQGKTLIIVLLILFHLFFLRTKRIIYTAQRWSTAADVFDRVVAAINRVPSLKKRLAKNPSKRDNHGVIELRNGAKAEFGPRSQDFARGYTEVDLLIIDEAYDVDAGQEAALTGSQSAADNPQTIYTSTPPVFAEHPKCHSLADMHRLGHSEAPDLFYRLFAAPRHMSRDDPVAYAMAQPSYGVATNEREIRSKRQKAKTAAKRAIFDADYMGWGDYPPPEIEGEGEIPTEVWNAMRNPDAALVGPRVVVLYRAPEGGPWAIVAAQRTADGRIHLEVGYCGAADAASVARKLVDVVTAWDPAALVVGRGAGSELLVNLEAAGIEAEVPNRTEEAQACGGFLNDALADGDPPLLSHGGHAGLDDAVANAIRHDMPSGGFVWEVVDGAAYAQLMGATLARWALLKFGGAPTGPAPKPAYDPAPAETSRHAANGDRWGAHDDQFNPMTAVF